jgi:uncharacterized SAM-binding protein YcdF (DUF218 family)
MTLLFDLQKLRGALVMPAGLLWTLLLGAALVLVRRRQWYPAVLVLLVWGCYGVAGNFYVGSALLASLEQRIPPLESGVAQPFDAVFVLGGGTEVDPAGEPMLGSSGDRVVTAARLWHAGKARVLVASGASRDTEGGSRDLGRDTRALWLALGVPSRAILVVEEPCWVTGDEIRAYRRLQEIHHWRRLALVSSAWHLPRAMGLAARYGLDVTPVGSDWRGRRYAFQIQRLVPQGEGFLRTGYACWEYLGRWMGR